MRNNDIRIEKATKLKEKPDSTTLDFGTVFTDHMFILDYSVDQGWHDGRIIPYGPIELDPAATSLHYGQTVFEGLKAYVTENDEVQLFRPDQNIARLNRSSERIRIPELDEEYATNAIKELVRLDKEWVPKEPGTSLYIRPYIIATEAHLGVSPSKNYKFIIILSPVGAYYDEGINPVKIAVEDKYVRAVIGGTGEAKTGGNYASSLAATEIVAAKGFAQVLWLDGVEKKYIEEVGSMNVFFKINDEIITPKLNGSILPGITRDSVIKMLDYWGMPVTERRISMQEIHDAAQNGTLEEAFGTGTAAVISPIGQLTWKNEDIIINQGKTGTVSKKLYDSLGDIQYGRTEDVFNWTVKID
ncbi:MAG TPA: branched-chain amino acid aminotransferase [Pseudogracilibacillus sp.]|nr:branched-chain amino acid aminotransferase [Pseudogracilibacillus sp.]